MLIQDHYLVSKSSYILLIRWQGLSVSSCIGSYIFIHAVDTACRIIYFPSQTYSQIYCIGLLASNCSYCLIGCTYLDLPLGMEFSYIPNDKITASSSYDSMNLPYYGRFNGPSQWCDRMDSNKPTEYLQVL